MPPNNSFAATRHRECELFAECSHALFQSQLPPHLHAPRKKKNHQAKDEKLLRFSIQHPEKDIAESKSNEFFNFGTFFFSVNLHYLKLPLTREKLFLNRFRTGNLLFWSLKVAFSLILPPTKRSCFLCLQEQILPHHDRFTFNLSVDLHIRQ